MSSGDTPEPAVAQDDTCASDRMWAHRGARPAKLLPISRVEASCRFSVAAPITRSLSRITFSPSALATACPDGSLKVAPRSRLRRASREGWEAIRVGRWRSGLASEVSIL